MWSREEAVEFCSSLDWWLRPVGWSVGLTGSCLHKGSSTKDVDIILYRLGRQPEPELEDLHAYLEMFRMVLVRLDVNKGRDVKHVEEWRYKDKRVDVFILK